MVHDMTQEIKVDIKENRILALDSALLNILLKENNSGRNIIWVTAMLMIK